MCSGNGGPQSPPFPIPRPLRRPIPSLMVMENQRVRELQNLSASLGTTVH